MTDLRAAAQQVLKALKGYRRELGDQQPCDAEQALEAALAEPVEPTYCPTCGEEDGGTTCGMPDCGLRCVAEPVQEPEPPPEAQTEAEKVAYCAGWWAALEKARKAEPVQEHNLSRCPKCNGPADNGHDREVPPNPYYCTKCMAEPVAWRWGYRSVTTGEMDWRGYVEIAAHPNLRSPEIIMEPLYTAPPQRKPLTSDKDRPDQGATYVEGYGYVDTRAVRAVERAHGIGGEG